VLAAGTAQPWRSDRAWDPSGEPGELWRRSRRVLWWGVAAALVLLPWNALAAGRPDLVPGGAVLVADLVPAALLLRGAWLRRRWFRGGAVRLDFERFPFFLGEPFEAILRLDPGTGGGAVEVTLACLEERLRDAGDEVEWGEVEVYRAVQVVLPAFETPLVFELPAVERQLGTRLGEHDGRRWELRVRGRAGCTATGAFPVPVYEPPLDGEPEAG
jgi:hypothetical protein